MRKLKASWSVSVIMVALCLTTTTFGVPARQTVRVHTYPVAAKVYLDGREMGKSPLTLSLSVQEVHQIVLKREHYKALRLFFVPRTEGGRHVLRPLADQQEPPATALLLTPDFVPSYPGPKAFEELQYLTSKVQSWYDKKLIGEEEYVYFMETIFAVYPDPTP